MGGERGQRAGASSERELIQSFIDNLLVRIHFIIVMIRWTGFAPWEFEFPFPGGGFERVASADSGLGRVASADAERRDVFARAVSGMDSAR